VQCRTANAHLPSSHGFIALTSQNRVSGFFPFDRGLKIHLLIPLTGINLVNCLLLYSIRSGCFETRLKLNECSIVYLQVLLCIFSVLRKQNPFRLKGVKKLFLIFFIITFFSSYRLYFSPYFLFLQFIFSSSSFISFHNFFLVYSFPFSFSYLCPSSTVFPSSSFHFLLILLLCLQLLLPSSSFSSHFRPSDFLTPSLLLLFLFLHYPDPQNCAVPALN
jgi:hypothetical protein